MTEEKLTVREVGSLGSNRKGISCVYIFMDENTPVYIGKTVNSKRRFESYVSAKSHNEKLNDFIRNNKNKKIVKLIECENPEILESELIKKYSPTLFNIKGGVNRDWKTQSKGKKPWVAGTGINCPTSIVIRSIEGKDQKDKVKNYLKSLSDVERCLIEIEYAMKIQYKNSVKKWLSITSGKMIGFLEAAHV